MPGIARIKDIGAFVVPGIAAFSSTVFTANAPNTGTDGVAQPGNLIDRRDQNSLAMSMAVNLNVVSTGIGAPDTLIITCGADDSADGTTWAPYLYPANFAKPVTVITNATLNFVFNVNLSGARRYVRPSVTCLFSAATVDAATIIGTATLGGFQDLPILAEGTPGIG
jgi:hypothetical protein